MGKSFKLPAYVGIILKEGANVLLIRRINTDLGIENETASGYYSRPWDWQSIQDNQQWIIQFASPENPKTHSSTEIFFLFEMIARSVKTFIISISYR